MLSAESAAVDRLRRREHERHPAAGHPLLAVVSATSEGWSA